MYILRIEMKSVHSSILVCSFGELFFVCFIHLATNAHLEEEWLFCAFSLLATFSEKIIHN